VNRREIRRGIGNFAAITRSRLAGNTYVPHPRRAIFIETSGRCNLACRFCAYAQQPPGPLMSDAAFADALEQVCELGFSHVWLTPMLGEVFADPGIAEKWARLDAEPRIAGYSFYTNFVLARPEQIDLLPGLKKLGGLYISIYGFDTESFERTTRKPASQLARLLGNLSRLCALLDSWQPPEGVHFNVRTVKSDVPITERETPIGELLRSFTAKGATVLEEHEYDTWGGTIGQQDVAPLGIDLVDGNHLYMHGACARMFSEVQIKADGQVHACACRDVDGSLIIGDLNDAPLKEILSYSNPAYRGLIDAQMKGKFTSNCRSCSFYRSVYDGRGAKLDPTADVMPIDAACDMLGR
jgi:radical SAM protein with 4Fe4S-binding SPASM domain